MPRKRPFSSFTQSKPAEDFPLNLSHHDEEWNGIPKYNQSGAPQSINRILIAHIVAALYGFMMLYTVTKNKYYSSINSLYFLPVLAVHLMFEYFKAIYFHKHLNSSHKNVKQFISTFALSVAISYTFAVLFGADCFELQGTFVFSCIITTLAIVPLFFETGKNCLLLVLFQQKTTKFSQKIALSITYCVIIGAWMGAFVIPLDWNRPWQNWPIPCVIGALLGYVIGQLICFGKLLFNFKF